MDSHAGKGSVSVYSLAFQNAVTGIFHMVLVPL